jgi:hypothetical protein
MEMMSAKEDTRLSYRLMSGTALAAAFAGSATKFDIPIDTLYFQNHSLTASAL